ncbi:uncharacterized protein DUF2479 [Tissierella praeacuta]|uniref:BppU family phage baseplate upper protein n=1 Tax=Tissierella praeacuta TaxID=43131 RepID=UPI00104367CD|nr:BppU family phage baseplate upper protein [Tissierella praeacuta]TCU67492.1 uncharacterized protein DUF2479 [Tissierella praeacuta]
MKLKEFDFSLDIKRHKRTEDIILVQNDRQTTKFNINLMDGNHAFLIGENAEISIVFQKSDDTYIEQECEFIGNKVSVILVDQVLTKSGKVIAEIIIRSDNQVLTTTSFDFHVRKNILNDNAIESTNEIGILNKLIDTVKELIQKVINSIPRIGDNGNWFIGDEDTGKPSRGPKGDKGDKGEQGPKGEKGDKGDRGIDGIGAVHSVNDQVGDVYLTGEDIRVNQNQQWSVSYALNKLHERTEYIPYATDAPVKLGGGEKCRTLISTETEGEKVFELSAHCSNWVLKFKSRINIELPDLNEFRWGTNEIKGGEYKWFTMRVLCYNQGSIPVQLVTEGKNFSGMVFWDGGTIPPSIQAGKTALVEYVGTYYRFDDRVVWLAKIIWQH